MGDQPQAIEKICEGFKKKYDRQCVIGVTGSGKTFTMANVIAKLGLPAMVLAPNKTLAAQLYSEFKNFFPSNAVEYFVSYYDYYQPEAYVPSKDLFIEKDSSINDHIEQMRLSATKSLMQRKDVIIVASVSCIYGIGDPVDYHSMILHISLNEVIKRDDIVNKLIKMQYTRSEAFLERGNFRIRGSTIDVFPAENYDYSVRIVLIKNKCVKLNLFDSLTGEIIKSLERFTIFPSSHYVTTEKTRKKAIISIKKELQSRLDYLEKNNKLIEYQRLDQRTNYDLEMLEEIGFCKGIENYSRHFSGRKEGEPPPTLIDYLPKDSLLFIDESHITIPQINGMYKGDYARKSNLIDFGFRLPSALDNRPLKFNEFDKIIPNTVYISATPSEYEIKTQKQTIELIVRPTGLIDPIIVLNKASTQVDNLIGELKIVISKNERALVTVLTKKMAEELNNYLIELGIKSVYIHSDINTVERVEIIRDLRLGKFDVIVGINLLREGLDVPEVSLVAILDGDKEGFLRSHRSLIQTIGRAARNVNGKVIIYADTITDSIKKAVNETNRRREKQKIYNFENKITPKGIQKKVNLEIDGIKKNEIKIKIDDTSLTKSSIQQLEKKIKRLEKQMYQAAKNLDFIDAAKLRDEINLIKQSIIKE